MWKSRYVWLTAAFVTVAASGVGCGSTADEVTNSISCGEVCARYSNCDADYDVDGCTDRCENDASASEDRERRLASCDACMNERSCSEASVSCGDACLGIVP